MAKVIVGLSGGVDSSVAALLLLRQGYEVEGLFMRNWDSAINQDIMGNPDLNHDVCPQEEDYMDAQQVADKLGIKLHRHDFIQEYWDDVFSYFLEEYRRGRTPNPDILCNKYIKFKAFLDVAKDLGADYIAMGHYARVVNENGETKLLRGLDKNKDQTYFLSALTQDQLKMTMFPIGHLEKSEVRKLALEAGFITAKKKDSTGICFIGERNFSKFLSNYLPAKPGEMKTLASEVIGKHDGLMYYTIGQRKGLQIGGSNTHDRLPWYVIGKDLEKNVLLIGQGIDHPYLYSDSCHVEMFNWIPKRDFQDGELMSAKFRYRQEDVPVRLYHENEGIRVEYQEEVRAVTPGQACVFYQGEECLGGGTIHEVYSHGQKRRV